MEIHMGREKVHVWSIFYPGEPSYFFLSALLGTLYSFPCCSSLYIPLTVNFLMVSCFYRHILFLAVHFHCDMTFLILSLVSVTVWVSAH